MLPHDVNIVEFPVAGDGVARGWNSSGLEAEGGGGSETCFLQTVEPRNGRLVPACHMTAFTSGGRRVAEVCERDGK